jgi:hypothetical protein
LFDFRKSLFDFYSFNILLRTQLCLYIEPFTMDIKRAGFVYATSKGIRLFLIKKLFEATLIFAFLVSFSFHAKSQTDISSNQAAVFPKGEKIISENITGTAWMKVLVTGDSTFNSQIANVTFEPGARTDWHTHPGGQILLLQKDLAITRKKENQYKYFAKEM